MGKMVALLLRKTIHTNRWIIVSTILLCYSMVSYSQTDSFHLRKAIELALKKYGPKDAKYELSVTANDQKGGQTAFVINNYNGRNNHINNGTINGNNGDINIFQSDYSIVAKQDMYGLEVHYGYGFTGGETELSKLMTKVLIEKEGKIDINLSDTSLFYAKQVIGKYPHFPFAYYAIAKILSTRNNTDWIPYARKAIEILNITTSIPGHNLNHDQVFTILKGALPSNENNGK